MARFISLPSPLHSPALSPHSSLLCRVADDESRHLSWCLQRLKELGYEYGCMPAHNLLWEGAEASAGDLGARLAIVPMSQEVRGSGGEGWAARRPCASARPGRGRARGGRRLRVLCCLRCRGHPAPSCPCPLHVYSS